MSIRRATPDDYEQALALWAEVDALHREARPDVFRPAPGRAADWFEARVGAEEVGFLVAEDGAGRLLGLLQVTEAAAPALPLFEPRRYAVVEELVVAADHQGQGVGRSLMEAAHRWARERGLAEVELHVWEFNQGARAFYEALGYATRSRRLGRRLD